jgi:hypothetical protein
MASSGITLMPSFFGNKATVAEVEKDISTDIEW